MYIAHAVSNVHAHAVSNVHAHAVSNVHAHAVSNVHVHLVCLSAFCHFCFSEVSSNLPICKMHEGMNCRNHAMKISSAEQSWCVIHSGLPLPCVEEFGGRV